ncbi:3-keto-disaccharide hydrolase [Olivibacter domesticus]|uniref:3-keto-alpha-glucoside-1,2-lyase/3-keto-2-hydroxy-glucal hydratase domain-containing protein n=1 Tax=Olivibacter domesticus TaxID=407022 RepID=A0A1H7R0V0_OLID1|nr:DUF1080 domain-containing protein [Olivibacter domesticus]SEL53866.1 protein of unknown function [Olivibacter domesticus]
MNILKGILLFFVLQVYHVQAQTQNVLTAKEKANGWQLVFDGESFNGLRKLADDGWEVKDGMLMATPIPHGRQMDIITEAMFGDFELSFEFEISKNTNSGVKYLVTSDFPSQKGVYLGLEYQILDDVNYKYPERGDLRSLASLYDLIPADINKPTKAIGQWNFAKIIVRGTHISHWLNGQKIVAYDRSGSSFKSLVQGSKYKDLENFGETRRGHLLFQNEGTPIAFRNIKIKSLN